MEFLLLCLYTFLITLKLESNSLEVTDLHKRVSNACINILTKISKCFVFNSSFNQLLRFNQPLPILFHYSFDNFLQIKINIIHTIHKPKKNNPEEFFKMSDLFLKIAILVLQQLQSM